MDVGALVAIAFYTGKLGFELVENTDLGDGKRWVLVAPPQSAVSTKLLLAQAVSEEQARQIGNQAGGRVFRFLHTRLISRVTTPYTGSVAYGCWKSPGTRATVA